MQQQKFRSTNPLSLVKTNSCRRTAYKTPERAREVLFFMTARGADTNKLRVIHCPDCRQYHLKYVR